MKLKWLLYRFIMPIMHRYSVHYMEKNEMVDPALIIHWCKWCGLTSSTTKKNPIDVIREASQLL